MTADGLSFEPVYVDGCALAPTPSMARTMRFEQLGIVRGKQPTGTTVDVSCGNPLCFAAEHVMLRGGRALAGSGPLWPRSSRGCRWAVISTCQITPAMRHRGVGCGVAWELRLRGGCCDSRHSPCLRVASVFARTGTWGAPEAGREKLRS